MTHGWPVFWQFVTAPPEDASACWPWPHYVDSRGYGRVGREDGSSQMAHRAVYEELVGAVPDGLELDHLCRNRACVNPAHLEPVTHAENMRRRRHQGHRGGGVRLLPSGRFQARYMKDGVQVKGPGTFATREDAEAWLRSVA